MGLCLADAVSAAGLAEGPRCSSPGAPVEEYLGSLAVQPLAHNFDRSQRPRSCLRRALGCCATQHMVPAHMPSSSCPPQAACVTGAVPAVQVVQSHSSNPAQQKQSQQMLTVSYVHRALEDVAGSQAQALLDKCWNMIAMLSPSSVRLLLPDRCLPCRHRSPGGPFSPDVPCCGLRSGRDRICFSRTGVLIKRWMP